MKVRDLELRLIVDGRKIANVVLRSEKKGHVELVGENPILTPGGYGGKIENIKTRLEKELQDKYPHQKTWVETSWDLKEYKNI